MKKKNKESDVPQISLNGYMPISKLAERLNISQQTIVNNLRRHPGEYLVHVVPELNNLRLVKPNPDYNAQPEQN